MSLSARLDRQDVIGLLATYRERTPEEVTEKLDSLELAWLIAQVEERFQVRLDLDDDQLAGMVTVPAAVQVLQEALASGDG